MRVIKREKGKEELSYVHRRGKRIPAATRIVENARKEMFAMSRHYPTSRKKTSPDGLDYRGEGPSRRGKERARGFLSGERKPICIGLGSMVTFGARREAQD